MESRIRVMLVEDDEDFREPVARYLSKVGLNVTGVGSVEEMDAVLPVVRPHVIVLDVTLPGECGLVAVERLRAETRVGLVMLTARAGIDDRLAGLQRGADSYLAKPVNARELEAVIRNLATRVIASGIPLSEPQPEWIFDPEQWTLTSPDREEKRLSAAEFNVLAALLAEPGQPVGRDALFDALGRAPSGPDDRNLDVLISRLRRKFILSAFSLPIRSVRGVGYVFPKPAMIRGFAATAARKPASADGTTE